jgi:hypothetical protein
MDVVNLTENELAMAIGTDVFCAFTSSEIRGDGKEATSIDNVEDWCRFVLRCLPSEEQGSRNERGRGRKDCCGLPKLIEDS